MLKDLNTGGLSYPAFHPATYNSPVRPGDYAIIYLVCHAIVRADDRRGDFDSEAAAVNHTIFKGLIVQTFPDDNLLHGRFVSIWRTTLRWSGVGMDSLSTKLPQKLYLRGAAIHRR